MAWVVGVLASVSRLSFVATKSEPAVACATFPLAPLRSPVREESVAVDMELGPGIPWGPGTVLSAPSAPGVPALPGIPCVPVSPFVPGEPSAPGVPFVPSSPGGPGTVESAPAGPRGPGGPLPSPIWFTSWAHRHSEIFNINIPSLVAVQSVYRSRVETRSG